MAVLNTQTNPSDEMDRMLKEGATAGQALKYWQDQGRDVSEINPNSSVGRALTEKAGGSWQEVQAIAQEEAPKETVTVRPFQSTSPSETIPGYAQQKNIERRQGEIAEAAQKQAQETYQKQLADFERGKVKGGGGDYLDENTYANLTASQKRTFETRGVEALNKQISAEFVQAVKKQNVLPDDIQKVYNESGPEDRFAILKSKNLIPETATYTGSKGGEPTYKIGTGAEEFAMSKEAGFIMASMIPIVGTAALWKDMTPAQRALAIFTDVAGIGLAGKIAAAAGRASQTTTRAARMSVAAKAFAADMAEQTIAPIKMVINPIPAVKATAREALDLFENIAHYKKLPEAVITNTDGTFRIPVSKLKSEKDAIEARERIVAAAFGSGDDVVIEMNGQRITLFRSALARETEGGAFHATPMGEYFREGLKVKLKPGMPMSEQGIFVAPEAAKKFSIGSAFGSKGDESAILVTSPKTAKDAIPTGKIYKKATELERKFPVDYELPAPGQVLFTRIGPERTKVNLLLETPLSIKQIAKLKALAVVEDVKALYKPGLLIEGKATVKGASAFDETLTEAEIQRLARALDQTGNRNIARNLRAVAGGLEAVRMRQRKQISASRRGIGPSLIATARLQAGNSSDRYNVYSEMIGRPRVRPSDNPISNRIEITARHQAPGTERTSRGRPETEVERASILRTTAKRPGTTEMARATGKAETGKLARDGRTDRPATSGKTLSPDTDTKLVRVLTPAEDKAARKQIEESDGAITWRQGKVGNKDVWPTIIHPYSNDAHGVIVVGAPPKGAAEAVRGKGSPKATAQMIKGKKKPAGTVKVDMGFSDISVSPGPGRKINLAFKSDPKQATKGDITLGRRRAISERMPPISERGHGISKRMSPISERTPSIK